MYKILFTEEAEAFLLGQVPKIRRQLFWKIGTRQEVYRRLPSKYPGLGHR